VSHQTSPPREQGGGGEGRGKGKAKAADGGKPSEAKHQPGATSERVTWPAMCPASKPLDTRAGIPQPPNGVTTRVFKAPSRPAHGNLCQQLGKWTWVCKAPCSPPAVAVYHVQPSSADSGNLYPVERGPRCHLSHRCQRLSPRPEAMGCAHAGLGFKAPCGRPEKE
jgi:hypothetical protein